MRIHGNDHLKRREAVTVEVDYKKYLPELREDFCHKCGYCGKPEYATSTGFEIDHFIPLSIDDSKRTDYSNLVYACFTCNRKKSNKWPTRDVDICHNGKEGFVDPCSEEYDTHLTRNDSGAIEGTTEVGRYMCESAFSFDLRPIAEIWKISQLKTLKASLYEKRMLLSKLQLIEYMEIDKELSDLMDYIFPKRE